MLEPTELASRLGFTSAIMLNKALVLAGLQVKSGETFEPTAAAEDMWMLHHWDKDGKTGYNLKWNIDKIQPLVAAYVPVKKPEKAKTVTLEITTNPTRLTLDL